MRSEEFNYEEREHYMGTSSSKLHNKINALIEENEQLRMKVIQLEDLVQTLIQNH